MAEQPVSFLVGDAEEEAGEELETGDSFPDDGLQNDHHHQQQQQQLANGLLERRRRLR